MGPPVRDDNVDTPLEPFVDPSTIEPSDDDGARGG